MTCQHCQGLAHLMGGPCPDCYGTGRPDATPVAASVVADRLRQHAVSYQCLGGLHGHQQAAFLRAAAVVVLGDQSPSTRDAEALRGLQNAAAAGMDLEAYAGLVAGHITQRGEDLIVRWILAHRTDSIRGALRALEVMRG